MIFTSRTHKLPYSWPVSMIIIEIITKLWLFIPWNVPKGVLVKRILYIYHFHEIWWLHDAYKQFWQNANFTKLYMPVPLHVLVCQAQNFDHWWIMVPVLQICKELENHCPTLRDFRKNEKLAKRQVLGVICPWPVFSHDVDTYEFWSYNIKVLLCATSIIASIPRYKNIKA